MLSQKSCQNRRKRETLILHCGMLESDKGRAKNFKVKISIFPQTSGYISKDGVKML